ncbi:MAG TPA: RIP metalloprotease RseP [Gemmatimonadales bacterium]|nr:RIP metalloprotease RseP [Gemmatimonadales bacterium]
MLLTIAALVVVLGVLIFVHELGHFLAAKWAGIYVHRFSLGLGSPVPWLTFRRGETEYSISWLPLGGYVKMASREEDSAAAMLEGGALGAAVPPDRVFEAKPVWKRMVVILAGVTMNVLFAWTVYIGLAARYGREVDPVTTVARVITDSLPPGAEALGAVRQGQRIVSVAGRPVHSWDDIRDAVVQASTDTIDFAFADGSRIAVVVHPDALGERVRLLQALEPLRLPVAWQVLPGSPAAGAGIQVGDTITAVDGQPVATWGELIDLLVTRAGRPTTIEVLRAGERRSFELTPARDTVIGADGKPREIGRIGIGITRRESYSLGEAAVAGTQLTLDGATQIVRVVRGLFSGRVPASTLGGPILIAQEAGQAARLGLDVFLRFMGLISINLAILNLLPIPVLDGGQFLLLLAEGVLRRPLPLKLRERLTALGLVFVVLLMVLAFSNDIRRLFGV